MKPPKRITVGPYTFRVRTTDAELASTFVYGETDKSELTITLNNSQVAQSMVETLFHETLHCVFYAAGITMPDGEEELLVRRLSPLLLDTLQRNPKLVAYLGGRR